MRGTLFVGNWACRAASLAPVHANNYAREIPHCAFLIIRPAWSAWPSNRLTASDMYKGHTGNSEPQSGTHNLKAYSRRCKIGWKIKVPKWVDTSKFNTIKHCSNKTVWRLFRLRTSTDVQLVKILNSHSLCYENLILFHVIKYNIFLSSYLILKIYHFERNSTRGQVKKKLSPRAQCRTVPYISDWTR